MLLASLVVAATLTAFAAIHALCALVALRWASSAPALESHDSTQRVAVILSVRGCDPSLADTVRGLLRQDFKNYEIHIVIDHRGDAAWEVVRNLLAQHDTERRGHIHELQSPPSTCSLKCAALVQAIRSLNAIEIVATIDADVAPHPQWLSTLIAPLQDESIGVVTGNHWFTAEQANPGTLLRSLWNAGALVPTAIFGNPWAGTAAMRLSEIRESGLLEQWLRSAVDDGPIRSAYRRLKKRVHFCPHLIMLNRESCTVAYFLRYMARILTWSRVYEPSFGFTLAHALVNLTPWIAGVVCLFASLFLAQPGAAAVSAVGLVAHAILLWSAYLAVRAGVTRVVALRGENLPTFTKAVAFRSLLLTPLALVLHGFSAFRALQVREMNWRGIRYQIRGPGEVVMTGYRPYAAPAEASGLSI